MNGRSQIVEGADQMEFPVANEVVSCCSRSGVSNLGLASLFPNLLKVRLNKRMNARMIPPKGGEDADLGHDGTRGVMTWSRRSLSPHKNVHAAPRSQMSA